MVDRPQRTASRPERQYLALARNTVRGDGRVPDALCGRRFGRQFPGEGAQNKSLREAEIVVRDFTKLFVTPQQLHLFQKGGGRIRVLQKSKLIGVTVNPTSPSGYVLDSETLCQRLSAAIQLPVYDLFKIR